MEIRIRAATSADVPVILRFIKDLAEFEKMSGDVSATEADLRLHLFGAKPVAEVLIAETADSVLQAAIQTIGFALYFTSFSTFLARPGLYLEDLYVKPEFRGFGVGRKLLAALARLCVERDCARLEWTVLDWNKKAIEFYVSLGATAKDEWTQHRLSGAALKALAALSSGAAGFNS